MGMFDTYCNYTKEDWENYKDEQAPSSWVDVQLKVGDPCCDTYFLGDPVDKSISDGLYLGHDGFVAIQGGRVVSVQRELLNTSGEWILCQASNINFGNKEMWGILYGKKVDEIVPKNKTIKSND